MFNHNGKYILICRHENHLDNRCIEHDHDCNDYEYEAGTDYDEQRKDGDPPFCSEAVSIAVQAGGVDPVPTLADRYTEPGDLARSLFFHYRFTLA